MLTKCLFPVGGYGTRFLPATKSMAKEMMPIVNKPLVQYGVEEAIEAGMDGMCIVTGRGKHSLMDHFDKNYELEHQISGTSKEALLDDIRSLIDSASYTYIRQREMKGLGHAILTGRELVGDEPFAVVLADDLCVNEERGVLAQMVELYKQFRCSIVAVQEVPETETHKYGVIAGEMIKDDIFRIDSMVEKLKKAKQDGENVVILTARSAEYRDETKKWLHKNEIPYDALIMRPTDNKEKDKKVKKELLEEDILPKFDVDKAYDDKMKNVKMFRKLGIDAKKVKP